ncbi:phosphoheptose isomerase [Cyclobacterium sp. 1_MG-2023]|uniref:cupin domain-containing protein n=1 Tax=Cyclobacterium sp. 1_MG-2023 TaxID=3062681 RepID=UPI0026E494B0|nr:phosphoheptose isomerase [Cyclobacterium sp. 1_MG-2023]MDO6436493.1 phosphoheptose isomerase [Cyclobacterium sp. 1_MG-2023]
MKIEKDLSKAAIFKTVESWLVADGFKIINQDETRPWGGFFVIDEEQISKFKEKFFPEVSLSPEQLKNKLSPKILLVGPDKRLSWQYHHRRAEIWKLVEGEGGLITSENDTEGALKEMTIGEVQRLKQGERHRLVGLNNWGVVAEIWMHTDPENPSDEEDIVRVQDDFSRK